MKEIRNKYFMSLDSDERKDRKKQKQSDKEKKRSFEKKERRTNYMNMYYKNKF